MNTAVARRGTYWPPYDRTPRPSAFPKAPAVVPQGVALRIRLVHEWTLRSSCLALAGSGLTPALYTVLLVTRDNPGMRRRVLADMLVVKQPNISAAIANLEAAGFVSREGLSKDRRLSRIAITDAGRRCLQEVQARLDAAERKLFSGLDAAERREFQDLLGKLGSEGDPASPLAKGRASEDRSV